MSAKTSHRRAQGTVKRGGRVEPVELDMTAWRVTTVQGIDMTVYTLGTERPSGYVKATLRTTTDV